MRKSSNLNNLLSKVNSQLSGKYVHQPKQQTTKEQDQQAEEDDGIQAYLDNLNKRTSNVKENESKAKVKPVQSFLKNKFMKSNTGQDSQISSNTKQDSTILSSKQVSDVSATKQMYSNAPVKAIAVEDDSSDSFDISIDESIEQKLKQDIKFDNKKLKPRRNYSVEDDTASADDSTDMKAYINALSVSTNISLKFADQLESHSQVKDNANTETNPYTEFATETINYDENTTSTISDDSIDEIIESRLNSPSVSRKRFVDLRSMSSSHLKKTYLSRSPSPLRSCLTTSRPLTPKSQLNRVVTLDEDVTEIIETRIDDTTRTSNQKTKPYTDDFDDVSVCSTNRTDYSYTSSNSYTSSMSSRRSKPYESSVTTFITTESDTSRTSASSRTRSRRHDSRRSRRRRDKGDAKRRNEKHGRKSVSRDYSEEDDGDDTSTTLQSQVSNRTYSDAYTSDTRSSRSSASTRPRQRRNVEASSGVERRQTSPTSTRRRRRGATAVDAYVQTDTTPPSPPGFNEDLDQLTRDQCHQHWNRTPQSTNGQPLFKQSSIAKHVINRDALNDLLAHNPSELAMNDMLKMQVSLTANFIETQKNLHRNLLNSLEGSSYRYTTLDDVKLYIKKHKKPKLTFKDALKQVKKEMGIV